jgi:hypothetical protein
MFLFMLATDINVALRWPASVQLFCFGYSATAPFSAGFGIASAPRRYEENVLFLVWH